MVAVKAHEADAFLRALPAKINAFLFYGSDDGLVAERARTCCKTASNASVPPGEILRIDDLDLESDLGRIATELTTIAMFGGRRIVRVSASRRITAAVIAPLLAGRLEGVLIVEAGNLKPDEGLRGLFEKTPSAAAIACYGDEARDLESLIRSVLTAYRLDISHEARQALVARLGADRAQSRAEVEKLALYCHGQPRVELADVEAATGDSSELALESVITAAAAGLATTALAAAERAFAAGESPQALIIITQRYFQRLHRVRASLEQTGSVDQAIKSLRPPLHFKARDAFSSHVQSWSGGKLIRALDRIGAAQRDARSSGIDETLAADRLILDLARLAAAPDRKPTIRSK